MTDVGASLAISPRVAIKDFWRTLGARATGLTIVTTDSDEGPAGFLGLSASHVCADPPTMIVSIDQKTSALAGVLSMRHFAVNYLPVGARDVADAFAGGMISGADRFSVGEWEKLVTGAPVLKGALGAFDCVVDEVISRGSTTLVLGTAVAAITGPGEPLVYFRGQIHEGVDGPK